MLAARMQAATGEPAAIWGDSIVGFGRPEQRYAEGKRMDWPLLGFSPRKSELSLCLMPEFENQQTLLARLGRHRTGKSCLYLKSLQAVVLEALRQVSVASVAELEPLRIRG